MKDIDKALADIDYRQANMKVSLTMHHAFEDKKVNMVNQRREVFNVTLDEIKEGVKKNFDKTVEFVDVPDAEQYRISQKLKIK